MFFDGEPYWGVTLQVLVVLLTLVLVSQLGGVQIGEIVEKANQVL